MNRIATIQTWFDLANPEPTSKNFHTQLGCHFEEIAEMVAQLSSADGNLDWNLKELGAYLTEVAETLKGGDNLVEINDQVEFLDSLCDQVVTGIGTGRYRNYDMIGAIAETDDSNHSKFVDGQPIFNENMKIMKGPDYFKPNLERFIRG